MSTTPRKDRAWAEVDLGRLLANARAIQTAAGSDALLPMVKAEAYGLGALAVVHALEPLDPWGFGLATIDEAIALREAGVVRRLLVFTPPSVEFAPVYEEFDLTAVMDDPVVATAWARPYHVEVDTGMGRCGVRWDAEDALRACAAGAIEGVFTHFHSADEGSESVERQWERLQHALASLGAEGVVVHAANSAGAWRLKERLDLVRPGIFLFGGRPAPDLPAPEQVLTLRAPVVSLRDIPEGESVSYGATWIAPRPTRVATVAIGYADGVSRTVGDRASVLLGGGRRKVVGRVTMDFIMVALQEGDTVSVGDVATIVGRNGDEEITIDEFAGWAGTNAYEALSRLGARVPRHYVAP